MVAVEYLGFSTRDDAMINISKMLCKETITWSVEEMNLMFWQEAIEKDNEIVLRLPMF